MAQSRAPAVRAERGAASGGGIRARLALLVLCGASFMVALDISILNVALPRLGASLGIGQASLQWGITAFELPSGGFLLAAGRVGDIVGRRRVFLAGAALFTAGSALAALAWAPAVFFAARVIQGLGAALIVPTAMALVTTSFAEGPARNRALGAMGTLMALGFTIGVVVGGVLTATFGWRSTMVLNGVLGAVVLAAGRALLTESRGERQRLDLPGAVTITGGLLALIYGFSSAAQHGWGRPDVLAALAGAAALLGAFAVIESRAAAPLVALRVLRRRTVAWGNLGGLVTFSMESPVIFLCTLYLQQVLRYSPLTTGLIFGVVGLGAAAGGAAAPRIAGWLGAGRMLPAGLLLQGVFTGALVLAGAAGGGALAGVILVLAAGGAGAFGHANAIVAYGIVATSGLPDREQGLATGLVTTIQQVGLTIGIPLVSALAAARISALRNGGAGFAAATLGGIRAGLAMDAAIVLAAALLLAVLLRRGAAKDPG
jgi:MFS family permease